MRIRTLIGAMLLVGFVGAGDAQAGWFNWGTKGWKAPEPAHAVLERKFHQSASEGAQIIKQAPEYKDARWGATSKTLLNHPVRPRSSFLRLK